MFLDSACDSLVRCAAAASRAGAEDVEMQTWTANLTGFDITMALDKTVDLS